MAGALILGLGAVILGGDGGEGASGEDPYDAYLSDEIPTGVDWCTANQYLDPNC